MLWINVVNTKYNFNYVFNPEIPACRGWTTIKLGWFVLDNFTRGFYTHNNVPKLYAVHSRLISLIPHHLYVLFNLFNVDVHSSIFLYPIFHCAMIKNNSLRLQLSIKINH